MNDVGFPVARVLDGISAAEVAGLGPIKLNAVIRRGLNEHAVVDLAEHFRGTGVTVRFIEYMDVGHTNGWRLNDVVPAAEIVDAIGARWPLEPVDAEQRGEVARRYRYRDGAGEIGVIASVPSRSAATAPGHACRPTGSSSPASSRPRATTFAASSAPGPMTTSWSTRCARSGPAGTTAIPSCAPSRPSTCPRWR